MAVRHGKRFEEKNHSTENKIDMWAAILNIILGIWIIVAPAIFQFDENAANNNYIVGPLIVTFAIVAIWEVNRSARYFNLVTGIWMIAAPFLLSFDSSAATWMDVVSGALVALFSLFKGRISKKYGGGWRSLVQRPTT
jgi:hypothetical protein